MLLASGIQRKEHLTETKSLGKQRKEVMTSRRFRKFAMTNMARSNLNPEAREMLLGHFIGLSNLYCIPDPDEILQEYLKAVDLLTIDEENPLRTEKTHTFYILAQRQFGKSREIS